MTETGELCAARMAELAISLLDTGAAATTSSASG
jgi:hypothetical protein